MVDGGFLILCGIPASGKSTLAKDLIKKDWEVSGKCVHFVYINYDDFIPDNLPLTDQANSAKWKDRRRNIINSLERLLLNQTVGLASGNHASNENTFVSTWCSCGTDNFARCGNIFHVVVIDDNMFYRSMRYEYYQLARKTSFSFCQVYLHCSLELAILQNAQRSVSLSEDTIRKMFSRIEKPDPRKFNWERFSVTISSGSGQSDDKWKTILKLLDNAAIEPAPPPNMADDTQKAKDRAKTMKNIVHQADQIIRKLISGKIEELKARNNSNEVLRNEASSLNQRRKTTMEQIKKDPRQIVHHFMFNHNNVCHDCQSELDNEGSDQVAPKSKTFSKCKDASASSNCLENPDERLMDETFLEYFWEITSPEEFADGVKNVFEQS